MSRPAQRIEICGALGSGKTTLARLFSHMGAQVALEPVETHPFLADFYRDPPRYAFQCQSYFGLAYLKEARDAKGLLVMDNGLPLLHAYTDAGPMSMDEKEKANRLLADIGALAGPADLTIHLTGTPTQLLQRIAGRGREMEKTVSADFLADLNTRLAYRIAQLDPARVMALDIASLEGHTTPASITPVTERIERTLQHLALRRL